MIMMQGIYLMIALLFSTIAIAIWTLLPDYVRAKRAEYKQRYRMAQPVNDYKR